MNTGIKILLGIALAVVVAEGVYVVRLIQSVNEKQASIATLEEAAKAAPRIIVDTKKFKNDSTIRYQGDYITITQQVDENEPTIEVYNQNINKPLEEKFVYPRSISVQAKNIPAMTNELVSLLLGGVSPVLSCTSTAPVVTE